MRIQRFQRLGEARRAQMKELEKESGTDGSLCFFSEDSISGGMPHFFLAYEGRQLLGAAEVTLLSQTEAEVLLCVRETARRQGIAKQLLAALADEAMRHGIVRLCFVAKPWQKAAQRLFRRLGGRKVSNYRMEYREETGEAIRRPTGKPCTEEIAWHWEETAGGGTVFVSIAGKRVAGCGVAVFADTAFLYDVFVLPAMRRQGIASAMLSRVLTWSGERGLSLQLHVDSKKRAACRLYRAFGFAVAEQLDVFWIKPEKCKEFSGIRESSC